MTKAVRVSASQVKLAKLCWRKWAFAYINGEREPETRALALGTLVHSILEAYLKDGTVPDPNYTWTFRGQLVDLLAAVKPDSKEQSKLMAAWGAGGKDDTRTFYPGKIALSMMPEGVFPSPGLGHVEHRFEWEDKGVVWNGLLDWHLFDPGANAEEFAHMPGHAPKGLIEIIDHKTSADPRKWGLDDDALYRDVQAVIYARAMLAEYGSANVIAHWNYGGTDGSPSKAKVATARYVPGAVYALFENEVAPIGQEIRRLRLMKADPLSLPPSPDNCYAYHKPCPHIDKCKLTTTERIGSLIMSTQPSGESIISSLLEEANAAAAPATPAAPVAPVAPVGAAPIAPVAPVGVAPTVPVAPVAPVAPVGAAPVAPAATASMPPVVPGAAVNPPEANAPFPVAPVAPLNIAPTAPPATIAAAAAPTVPLGAAPAVTPTPPAPPAATPKPRKPRGGKAAVDMSALAGSPEFMEMVADKVADKIAAKLLGGGS